ncbi:MAG: hypothetical protein O3B24_05930 [Verrucomicrobia bacterium]|nr:hypothetical protein [Verrucomicrobiota bacterium]
MLTWYTPRWDPQVMTAGAYFAPWSYASAAGVNLRDHAQRERLLFFREGRTATVSVVQTLDERINFCSDGKVEADTSPRSMTLQRLIAHLPMLCHRAPQRALNIGLGAGVTLGALACHPLQTLDVVEIEPAVTNVVQVWAPWNHAIGTNPLVRLHVNDGRNHLLLTTGRFDVITSDPFEPVVAGAASLYTVEHFQLARQRLRPGGIMAQFLPLYELSNADVGMLLRSFATAFPHAAVFFTGYDTILLGFTEGAGIDMEVVAHNFGRPAVAQSLADVGVTEPGQLLEMLVLELQQGAEELSPGTLNTDDRPLVEFSAPRSALAYQPDRNQRVLLEAYAVEPDLTRYNLPEAWTAKVQAGRDAMRLTLAANLQREGGDARGALELLYAALRRSPANPITQNELTAALAGAANAFRVRGDVTNAAVYYHRALEIQPDDFWSLCHLAGFAIADGQWGEADRFLARGLAAYPDAPLLIAMRGRLAGSRGNIAGAERDLRAALLQLPRDPELWDQYAYVLEHQGNHKAAELARAHAVSARD